MKFGTQVPSLYECDTIKSLKSRVNKIYLYWQTNLSKSFKKKNPWLKIEENWSKIAVIKSFGDTCYNIYSWRTIKKCSEDQDRRLFHDGLLYSSICLLKFTNNREAWIFVGDPVTVVGNFIIVVNNSFVDEMFLLVVLNRQRFEIYCSVLNEYFR